MVDTRAEIGRLADLYIPIAVLVFAIVVLGLLFIVVRFRHREGRRVSDRVDAPRLEAAYLLGLAGVVVVLLAATYHTESRVDAQAARPALRIRAVAADWRWRFDYPAQAISQLGSGGAPPELVVPAGQTVQVDLTSLDVVHAFWIPDTRFQREAFPDHTSSFDLVFGHPGVQLSGACNEFCGLGHTQMRFVVRVLSPGDFGAWVSRRQATGASG